MKLNIAFFEFGVKLKWKWKHWTEFLYFQLEKSYIHSMYYVYYIVRSYIVHSFSVRSHLFSTATSRRRGHNNGGAGSEKGVHYAPD